MLFSKAIFTIFASCKNYYLISAISFAVLSLTTINVVVAEPYIPNDDEQVLLTLNPSHNNQNGSDDVVTTQDILEHLTPERLTKLTQQSATNVIPLITAYIQHGKQQAKTRYIGYAQALLEPLLDRNPSDSRLLLLQAEIAEFQHRFPETIELLQQAIASSNTRRNRANAHLRLANLYTLQGQYAKAARECQFLRRLTTSVFQQSCTVVIQSRTGQLTKAQQVIEQMQTGHTAENTNTAKDPKWQAWLANTQAELAAQTSTSSISPSQYFQQAIQHEPDDLHYRLSYVDWLLLHANNTTPAQEAERILQPAPNSIGVQIRRAYIDLLQERPTSPVAATRRENIDNFFQRAELTNDQGSLRELAYYQFFVQQHYALALTLALQNWQIQKEPLDTYLVLAANAKLLAQNDHKLTPAQAEALAAEVKSVRQFLDQNQYEDARLAEWR